MSSPLHGVPGPSNGTARLTWEPGPDGRPTGRHVVQCDVCGDLPDEVRGPHEAEEEAVAALMSHEGAAGW